MKQLTSRFLILTTVSMALWSCGNISEEVESKLKHLENKTKSLDSLVNTEINKVQ